VTQTRVPIHLVWELPQFAAFMRRCRIARVIAWDGRGWGEHLSSDPCGPRA
jgi:hypothetical protein